MTSVTNHMESHFPLLPKGASSSNSMQIRAVPSSVGTNPAQELKKKEELSSASKMNAHNLAVSYAQDQASNSFLMTIAYSVSLFASKAAMIFTSAIVMPILSVPKLIASTYTTVAEWKNSTPITRFFNIVGTGISSLFTVASGISIASLYGASSTALAAASKALPALGLTLAAGLGFVAFSKQLKDYFSFKSKARELNTEIEELNKRINNIANEVETEEYLQELQKKQEDLKNKLKEIRSKTGLKSIAIMSLTLIGAIAALSGAIAMWATPVGHAINIATATGVGLACAGSSLIGYLAIKGIRENENTPEYTRVLK